MLYEENFGEEFERLSSNDIPKQKRRVLVKKQKETSKEIFNGVVTTSKGRYYYVKKINGEREIFKCVVAGSIEVKHSHDVLVTVGDRCDFVLPGKMNDSLGLGRIIRVADRKTFLIRKSIVSNKEDVIASNMDQVLIILAVDNPKYNLRMLDKILVASEYGGVTPIICVNKIDLLLDEKVKEDFKVYIELGYEVFFISAKNAIGLEQIVNKLLHKETLLLGVSGVGKSTLVNSLFRKEIQKVGKLAKNMYGRHTTTACNYLNLNETTAIIDSPGFREFELIGIPRQELPFYFPDFSPYFQKCKFQPCSHTHEPGCKVKKAVEMGKVSYNRYLSYLTLYQNF